MPTTFTGLLIFLAFLAPGFAFLIVFERGARPTVERSVLRETALVILASLACNAVTGVLFALVRYSTWIDTPDPSEFLAQGNAYFAENLDLATAWVLALFVISLAVAVLTAGLLNRPSVQSSLVKYTGWLVPGVTVASAWWKLLKEEERESYRRVTCALDDGTVIEGWLLSLNASANETADRELTLSAPLRITAPNSVPERLRHGSMAISANRIQYLHVTYWANPPKTAQENNNEGRA